MVENSLLKDKHILLCLDERKDVINPVLDYLKKNFCGTVLTEIKDDRVLLLDRIIYLCGNIFNAHNVLKDKKNVYVIKELSNNYDKNYEFIDIGQVPINIHNVGIYFRNFFDSKDYFDLIKSQHQFQTLTESNKLGSAFRKGIYLSKVERLGDELKYNILRCSTNLDGPTDNFRNVDNEIIDNVNKASQYYFSEKIELNHVLAQIYENNNQGKAKIKAHSDKTKDMPLNGLIAFCTFYESFEKTKKIKQSKSDPFDYHYNETSVLSKLHFKLKKTVKDTDLIKEFTIVLYPNSVFLIPLSTNRLYTHEIKPSILPFDKIATRMGYIVRCSKTKAIFKNDRAYIDDDGKYVIMEDVSKDNIAKLRTLYYEENTTDQVINYGNIYFSMNKGDYMRPNL